MANLKISELPQASTLQGTEELAVVQGGTTKKSTLNDVRTYATRNYITPTNLTVIPDEVVNLNDATYQFADMIRLSWNGSNGNMTLNLPDATDSINVNRVIRFISNGGFATSTRVNLTPILGQTLDGDTDAYVINKEFEGIQVWSDGVEWFIIQKKAS